MIVSRQHFEIKDQCVIEKLVIKAPFRFKGMFHEEACFLYLKEGSLSINASTEKTPIRHKEGVLLNCGNYFVDFVQQAPTGESMEVFAIHLYRGMLKEIYKNEVPSFIKGKPINQSLKPLSNDILGKFIESLLFYFENPALVNEDLLGLKLKELILLLLQTSSGTKIVDLFSSLYTPRLATIQEVLNTHLFSEFSVEELATLSGMSLSSFKREFQKIYKDSPGNYIKTQRLQRAAELLLASDRAISEIAFEVGFKDLAHFSRSFTAQYQQSPSQYKQTQPKI